MSQNLEELYAKRKAKLENKFKNNPQKLADRLSRLDKIKALAAKAKKS